MEWLYDLYTEDVVRSLEILGAAVEKGAELGSDIATWISSKL